MEIQDKKSAVKTKKYTKRMNYFLFFILLKKPNLLFLKTKAAIIMHIPRTKAAVVNLFSVL